MSALILSLLAAGALVALPKARARLLLSRAKHPSLLGHPRMARRLARLVPAYDYDEAEVIGGDGAPPDLVERRQLGFARLARTLRERSPKTLAASEPLEAQVSDVAFVNAYRVPFQYRRVVNEHLRLGTVIARSEGSRVCDLDGNWSFDLGGSYGVNLFGGDLYRRCIERGVERARDVGMVLGPYHPVLAENVERLRRISGMDEVSFHMSGTEAVMQAVRLARYHTGRSHVVRFCGAYHGWSDGLQAGPGNPRPVNELYTLREMSELSLEVLRTRDDIACVLVNPLQALAPNAPPAADSSLLASDRTANGDKETYAAWLADLRAICTERGIALIFDEVFLGFRLALGGVQEFFGVRADLVTYGKTLGGGLPVGVVCGRAAWMRRFRDDRPADVCFARGTFNSHPYVMTAMNELLRFLDSPEASASYRGLETRWNARAATLNARLAAAECPVRVANLVSVWTTVYTQPGRYNWLLQYYLRAHGLSTAWIGTGRFIFSHDLSDQDFDAIVTRFVAAASAMKADGWFWENPALTNESIKRQVFREMLRVRFGRARPAPAPPARPASDPTIVPARDTAARGGTA